MQITRYILSKSWKDCIREVANSLRYIVRVGDTFQSDGLCCNYREGKQKCTRNATLSGLYGEKWGKPSVQVEALTDNAEGWLADRKSSMQVAYLAKLNYGGDVYVIA